jgi:glutaredoxin 2
LVPVACSSAPKDEEPLLSPEDRAELQAFVDKKMAELPGQVQLSKAQREGAAPFAQAAARKIFEEARKYHAKPTPDNLKRFSRDMKKIRDQLSIDIKPLMTSSQRYTYMSVFDKVLQEIRNLDLTD